MGLKEWLIPQDKSFFALLGEQSNNVMEGAKMLLDLINDYQKVDEKRRRLKEVEHRGDEIVRRIYEKLDKTFITPIDHEDISKLTTIYDDILDGIYDVANRLYLYGIREPTQAMRQLADIVLRTVAEIKLSSGAIPRLEAKEAERRWIEVDRLEKQADELLNQSVADLFRSKDAVEIIKHKEIYEYLEIITDKCEDLTDVLRDVVIKRV